MSLSGLRRAAWWTALVTMLAAAESGGEEPAGPLPTPVPAGQPGDLHPVILQQDGALAVEFWSGQGRVGLASEDAPAGLAIRLPGEEPQPVRFERQSGAGKEIVLGPTELGGLSIRLLLEKIGPALVRRRLEVTASRPQKFSASLLFSPAREGQYYSFSRPETSRVLYNTYGGGPEHADIAGQTFPVAAVLQEGRVFGVIADTPAHWENRCNVLVDPPAKRLAVLTGDGCDPHTLSIDGASYTMDGWQSLAAGETRSYDTWLFADQARTLYDVQLAAHLALANAKGWNGSGLEAILRNTAYLLARRNLMRSESRYIFISGIGYGWKQWVSDGFYMAIGLSDPEKLIEAYRGVYAARITYEDNAQYYLIWSVLAKRAGGQPNGELVRLAYEFIRKHEQDGIFNPPSPQGASVAGGFKTYMDLLPYANDDPPVSNQGFHCGALLAAQELGLAATEDDVRKAAAGYQRMYNSQRRFFPTSLQQQEVMGQDTLYGAALTYAVFGRKALKDEQVLGHMQTTLKVQSPYGMRVISKADGSLLPGHSGAYVWGGSWFFCDSANYLLAGAHGMPADEVDRHLVWRIEKELARVPAFNESLNTVTGEPHGHVLYSANSGYLWLRQQFRKRLGQAGPDPVEQAIDRKLGVVRDAGGLRLDPALATLRPGR